MSRPSVGKLRSLFGRAWLRAFGWEAVGPAPDVPKAVFVAAPHTSNWDLPFTLAVAWSLGVEVSWVGKHTLFRGPFGPVMRALGGVPVDRTHRTDFVRRTADAIRDRDEVYVLIAPSGTRGMRGHWKSGFYHLAREADVPLILGFLDYAKKRGGIGPVLRPTGDVRRDMDRIRAFYADVRGKKPDQAALPILREEDVRNA